jgi:hypothetical protein
MPNREHAAVKTVQATDSNRPMNRAFRISQRPVQLVEGNDSVLAFGEIRKPPMHSRVRRTLVSHSGTKVRRTLVLPRLEAELSLGAQKSRRRWAGGFLELRCGWS